MALSLHSLEGDKSTTVAVVGLGLVGGAISRELGVQPGNKCAPRFHKVNWKKPASLIEPICRFFNQSSSDGISLIWAAGKAGFGSSEKQLDDEKQFFYRCVTQLHEQLYESMNIGFISSAGGIYEHSGFVQSVEETSATRAYAYAKLDQEKLLQDLKVKHRIYRASTVYGLGGNRQGLISTMLRSAKFRTPMSIYAELNTIRDYVYNHDLAKKVVADLSQDSLERIEIAATGRGLSIATLIRMVEQITNRRVMANFHSQTSNASNIYFSPQIVSDTYSTTSIEEGIRIMHKLIN